MAREDFNMNDPAQQEKIRRGTHEYVGGDGRHGRYVSRPFLQQEYPKQMLSEAAPKRKSFKTEQEFVDATKEWQDRAQASIVKNKAEEEAWLAENAPVETVGSGKKAKSAA